MAGLKPNVAERAGITEDYILTDVKIAGDSKSAIGLASMYEIEGISESDLKSHLNHQIEVTGSCRRLKLAQRLQRRPIAAMCRISKPPAYGWCHPPARQRNKSNWSKEGAVDCSTASERF